MTKFLFRKSRKCIQKSSKKKYLHLLLTLARQFFVNKKCLNYKMTYDKMSKLE